jgi:hypothetical protein
VQPAHQGRGTARCRARGRGRHERTRARAREPRRARCDRERAGRGAGARGPADRKHAHRARASAPASASTSTAGRRRRAPVRAHGRRGAGINGEGRQGVRSPASRWVPWGAIALEPGVVFSPIPRLGIFGSVGALAAFNRPGFRVGTETSPVFRVSAISAVVTLGIEVNFSARKRGTR